MQENRDWSEIQMEINLVTKAQLGDTASANRLVLACQPMIAKAASFFYTRYSRYCDATDNDNFVSIGTLSIYKAINSYDPTKACESGAQFTTYANWWVKRDISRAISKIIKHNHNELDLETSVECEFDDTTSAIDDIRLRQAVMSLPQTEYWVVKLKYGLDGGDSLTYEQIGTSINKTPRQVKYLYSKALDKIKAHFYTSSAIKNPVLVC